MSYSAPRTSAIPQRGHLPGSWDVWSGWVHEVRFVYMDGRPHLPPDVRQWAGDSRGHWQGDTLVVETTNFTNKGTGTLALSPRLARRGLGGSPDENLHLVERFTRVDLDTLLYEFTIDDPTIWTRPWTVSLPMTRTKEQIYEYACHEGNYGLVGILSGARAQEKAAETGGKKEGPK